MNTDNLPGDGPAVNIALRDGQALSLDEALRIHRTLAEQVAELHRQGRIHCRIDPSSVVMDGGLVSLATAPDSRPFNQPFDAQLCPPELQEAASMSVPSALEDAREALSRAGLSLDPRRIDVYQLAALLCRLLSGRPVAEYLRSPRAKASVPVWLAPVIDRALGYHADNRIGDCPSWLRALDEAAAGKGVDLAETPGHGLDLSTNLEPLSRAAPATATGGSGKDASTRAEAAAPLARLGHFAVRRHIGRGGMGDVYEGYDESLKRPVAIKILREHLAAESGYVRRFHAEATAVANLNHPNIVQVYFVGEDAGRHYFAMQYVPGETLAERLARDGALPLTPALGIARQCLAALAEAHAHGLVHRDVKPANILLDPPSGRALLTDFGLVKGADDGASTAAGVVMGTVGYMSPEQVRGGRADARSDLYGLGVVLFRMLAGRLPFEAESPTGMAFQHAYEPPPHLGDVVSDVPPRVAAIVSRLLAKDPAARYASATDVLAELDRLVAGEAPTIGLLAVPNSAVANRTPSVAKAPPPVVAPPQRDAVPTTPRHRSRRWALPAAGLIAALTVVAAWAAFGPSKNGPEDGEVAAADKNRPAQATIATPANIPPPPDFTADRKAAARFLALGGQVRVRFRRSSKGPTDLISELAKLPIEPFTVDALLFNHKSKVRDDDLRSAAGLPRLSWLVLSDTAVGDRGLAWLGNQPKLADLALFRTQTTDVGLGSVGRFTALVRLDLASTEITDAGLVHLGGLTKLEILSLSFNDEITDAGLVHLRPLAGTLRELQLDCHNITDDGLAELVVLDRLERLTLRSTKVTDLGLVHLRALTRLTYLNLEASPVTPAAVEELRRAMPQCRIQAWNEPGGKP